MGRCLRSLEQSLKAGRTTASVTAGRPVEGASGLAALQEQIEVVRGQRMSMPTDSLRALEHRVLGYNSPPATRTAYPVRETLRLDQGQVAPTQPIPTPYVPDAYPVDVNVPPVTQVAPVAQVPPVAQVNAASYLPQSSTYQHNAPVHLSKAYDVQAYGSQGYAPEFSAPDTGRFHVESFADDDDRLTIPAMPSLPAADQPTFAAPDQARLQAPVAPSLMPAGNTNNSEPTIDDSDWISAAQSERPAKITAASKQSLNPSLALAKNDFERELAAILGTGGALPAAEPEPDALFNPNAAAQPAPTPAPAPTQPAEPVVAHPNHSVFDQMGLAMRYANSFDLGNVSLKDRFDHFEQDLLAAPAQNPVPARTQHSGQAQSMSSPFVDPMNLDEFDLVAELAEIGVDAPARVQAPPTQQVPVVESQQPTATPVLAPDVAPTTDSTVVDAVKPTAPFDPNNPINKPINRTETTAGDDHE